MSIGGLRSWGCKGGSVSPLESVFCMRTVSLCGATCIFVRGTSTEVDDVLDP